jgi:hypothetical protein
VPPVARLGPHVAALGMTFYRGKDFGEAYDGDIFIAEHGSWNRSEPIGYRVMRVDLKAGGAPAVSVFASGWLEAAQPGAGRGRAADARRRAPGLRRQDRLHLPHRPRAVGLDEPAGPGVTWGRERRSMPEKIFAVGDIHGCADKLRTLIARLPFTPGRDRLIFLGDYVTRGPDSRGVIEELLLLWERCPDTVFLKGNHEHALLEYARTGELDYLHLLRSLGVEATLSSYAAPVADRKSVV